DASRKRGKRGYTKRYLPGDLPPVFLLGRKGSPPLKVPPLPAALMAEAGGQRKHFGLYSYSALAEWASDYWISHWEQPVGKRYAWRWVRECMVKAIRKHLHAPWQQLLQRADPLVVAVHRAIFAAPLSEAPIATSEALYRDQYLVHDILHYRAAAIAARHVDSLGTRVVKQRLLNSPEADALRAVAKKAGVKIHLPCRLKDEEYSF